MVYRVMLKVGYYERWFEFMSSVDAMYFAETILKKAVDSEDNENPTQIAVWVEKEAEKEDSEDE